MIYGACPDQRGCPARCDIVAGVDPRTGADLVTFGASAMDVCSASAMDVCGAFAMDVCE